MRYLIGVHLAELRTPLIVHLLLLLLVIVVVHLLLLLIVVVVVVAVVGIEVVVAFFQKI